MNLGHVLEAQGKLDEAIACFRKAIEIDPKSARARDALGTPSGRRAGTWSTDQTRSSGIPNGPSS